MKSECQSISQQRAWTRRQFLRTSVGAGVGSTLFGFSHLRALAVPRPRKIVVVTFGGGARDEETFAPEGQENIPHLLHELIPQATFCTQVVNHGILGHYVATASLATGVYETFDNFSTVVPDHPTVFEYYRKTLRRPATDTWVIAPSNGFNHIGESKAKNYGADYGASVILPKHLLAAVLLSKNRPLHGFEYLLQDNFENPLITPQIANQDLNLRQVANILNLSVDSFLKHAQALSSADELSVFVMRQLMQQLSPNVIWITLHDMDIAHAGAYSLYLDGIRRTDRLCGEIWTAIQSSPEYKNRTTMFILPDFGRDSDLDAGGNGFQHHRTGDPLSRTTWMMVLGPHVRANLVVNRALDSLDLAPTIGALMGFQTPLAQGQPVLEVL